MTLLFVLVSVVNVGILVVTWRITRSNQRLLSVIHERERRANSTMYDAAVDKGRVLTLVAPRDDDEPRAA